MKLLVFFLFLEIIHLTFTINSHSNDLIKNICDTLHDSNSLRVDEDQQWESICNELFHSNDNNNNSGEQDQPDSKAVKNNDNVTPQTVLYKPGARGGGSRGSRGGSSGNRGGSSGIRKPSTTQYRNTRTGTTIQRPNGWLWSRTRYAFLPISTRFLHRSRSSSNRFTTPSTNSENYYYCTLADDYLIEIQCNSISGDNQCCEDSTSRDAFCCGGSIPDDLVEDPNKATKAISQFFYTLSGLTLVLHFVLRRFNR